VPFAMYAPGNEPSRLAMGKSCPSNANVSTILLQSTAQLSSTQNGSFAPQPQPVNKAYLPSASLPGEAVGVQVDSYAEMRFSLPAGIRPKSLELSYLAETSDAGGSVSMVAYNVRTNKWDKLSAINLSSLATKIPLANPTQYTSESGEVVVRVLASQPTKLDGTFEMSLNEND
ncbi:MAG: hypothetical protein ABIQ44_11505, partial [Chloroflexia bacterium]